MAQEKGIDRILTALVTEDVSDIHFKVGSPPVYREGGRIIHAPGYTSFEPGHIDQIIREMLTESQQERFKKGHEVDMAYSVAGKARFRVNLFWQRGTPAIVMRKIPFEIPGV